MRLLLGAVLAWVTLVPARAMAQAGYAIANYTSADGLPQNTVGGLAQTPDGFLWVATFDGLARYDGLRFTVFDRGNTPVMKATLFETLTVDGEGTLWGGTSAGMLTYRHGRFTWHDPSESTRPDHTAQPQWYRGYVPRAPKHWRYGASGVISLSGDPRPLPVPFSAEDFEANSFEDRRGRLWVATQGQGAYRITGRQVTHFGKSDGLADTLTVGGEDRTGAVWFYNGFELFRINGDRATHRTAQELIGTRGVRRVITDRDGILWIGTGANGLFRLGPPFLMTHSTEQGLLGRFVNPIYEDRAGTIWIGNAGGLTRIAGTRTSSATLVQSRPGGPVTFVPGTATSLEGRSGRHTAVAFAEDHSGLLWVGSDGFAVAVANDRIVETIQTGAEVSSILETRDGTLWLGTPDGLFRRDATGLRSFSTAAGFPDPGVTVLLEATDGTLWVGTKKGLLRRDGDRFVPVLPLVGEYIRALYQDQDGVLWVGTFNNGLRRIEGTRYTAITTREGLFSNGAFAILPDAKDRFWISSNQGIYRVSRRALNDLAAGRTPTVGTISYGVADGMRTSEMNGGRQPAGFRSREGQLWFGSQDGAVVIDPSVVAVDSVAPPVAVELLIVDGVELAGTDSVHLNPGQRDLEVRYTAPSSMQARGTRFRYRLSGIDSGWISAGTRRSLHFAHLPPGRYALRISAGNADGVWDRAGITIPLQVDAYFYQTRWFYFLLGLAAVGLTAGWYRRRVERLQTQENELNLLVQARTAELEAANAQLQQLASEDPLTGLANRRHLLAFLQREWQLSRRHTSPITLCLLDIDHFKLFNDTYGHPEGDACLKEVARALKEVVSRSTDLVARFGGEEFAIVLIGNAPEGARLVAEGIRSRIAALGRPHAASPTAGQLTVSIGLVTTIATSGMMMEGLISGADQALYRAKQEGRDRVVVGES